MPAAVKDGMLFARRLLPNASTRARQRRGRKKEKGGRKKEKGKKQRSEVRRQKVKDKR
jgi:hypothetical protein